MSSLKIHPLASMMPVMSDDQYDMLLASVEEIGLQVPIKTLDGYIVDGRHRWRAIGDLKDRGIEIEARFEELPADCNVMRYIHHNNVARRHLLAGQRAALAVSYKQVMDARSQHGGARPSTYFQDRNAILQVRHGEPLEISERDTSDSAESKPAIPTGRNSEIAGRVYGVSRRTVERAQRLNNDAPDLFVLLKSGDIPEVGIAEQALRHRLWEEKEEAKKQKAAEKAQSTELETDCTEHSAIAVEDGEVWALGAHRLRIGVNRAWQGNNAWPMESFALMCWPRTIRTPSSTIWSACPIHAYICPPDNLAEFFDTTDGRLLPDGFELATVLSCHVTGDQSRGPVGFSRWCAAVIVTREGQNINKREEDARTVKWREKDGDIPLSEGGFPLAMYRWLIELFTERGDPVVVPCDETGGALIACHALGRIYHGAASQQDAAAIIEWWASETGEEPALFDVPAQIAGKGHGDS